MSSAVTQVIAVLAFLLAVVSLGWQVWSYRADRRERLDASASFVGEVGRRFHTIRVTVSNVGRIPVYLEDIAIAYDLDEPPLSTEGGKQVQELGGSISLFSDDDFVNPLAAGDARTFALPDSAAPVCASLDKLAPDNICVRVQTRRGTVYHIPGREVHSMICGIAQSVAREEEKGNKKG